jgi:hypothetical protein
LAEIKSAVCQLSPKELAELAAFVLEQDNAAWDKQMEKDAASGKLDFLFEEAERERGGRKKWTRRHRLLDNAVNQSGVRFAETK